MIGKRHETTIKLPGFVAGLASALLPRSAHTSLAARGIVLRDIAAAIKQKTPYSASLAVRERGVDKRVVISPAKPPLAGRPAQFPAA